MKRRAEGSNAGHSKRKAAEGELASSRVYVGNLSYKVTEEGMRSYFGSCGPVRRVDFITDGQSGRFYGTAFVEFERRDSPRKALTLNATKFLGRVIRVQLPKDSAGPASSAGGAGAGAQGSVRVEPVAGCRTVFVGRLPLDCQEEELARVFGEAGEVIWIRWVQKKVDSPVACGFVEFASEDAAAKAVELFHGKPILGAHGVLRVNLAPDRPRKPAVVDQTSEVAADAAPAPDEANE